MAQRSARHTQPYVGTCAACGKRAYATRTAARKAARSLNPGEAMRAYQCGTYWHIGHVPDFIRQGRSVIE